MIFTVTEKKLIIDCVLGREHSAVEATQHISVSPLP